ncbi:unnamed protein product [Effrenium voratum]|nr:unnamed protein product [Effrenium voratum]
MKHTWQGYRSKAWGHDEVQPGSGKVKDWCKMAITMLDGLSTLWVMGLKEEFEEAAVWLESSPLPAPGSHGQHSLFEINIRGFAGLLSAYSLSGKQIFLTTAQNLGEKLLGAFGTPSGMPLPTIDVGTGKAGMHSWNANTVLAEVTTLQVEFRYISQITGDQRWQEAADKALDVVMKAAGNRGLEEDEKRRRIAQAVLSAILKICALIAVGVHLERRKILNAEKRKCLSALAMDLCLPCLLFSAVLPEADPQLLVEAWELLLWPFCYATVSAVLGMLCCLAVGIPTQHLGAAAACAAFPNVNGFPVSVISALGSAIPNSRSGFSAMVFLSIIQLTDGLIKYTLGPAIFRRDKRARGVGSTYEMPLGHSLHSIEGDVPSRRGSVDTESLDETRTAFGLTHDQVCCVEPEWSRFNAYQVFFFWGDPSSPANKQPLLQKLKDARSGVVAKVPSIEDVKDLLRQMVPPQVMAVLIALAIGLGPEWLKRLLVLPKEEGQAPLGFIYGTAKELGNGFVPLQMISLGGRMLNVVGSNGPLASQGANSTRSKLLRISAAVGVARMVLAPIVLYFIAAWVDKHLFRPRGEHRAEAFWATAFIVSAMPTANNMSTMADLIGSGRSIAAASTAMQLMAAPVVLVASLSMLLSCAEDLAEH